MRVPSAEIAGGTTNRLGLSVVTTNVVCCPASLAGPGVADASPDTDRAPRSDTAIWLPPIEHVGASLTGWIAIVNVAAPLESTPPAAVPPLSWATTDKAAEPYALAAGVYVRVPSAATDGWSLERVGQAVAPTEAVRRVAVSASAARVASITVSMSLAATSWWVTART